MAFRTSSSSRRKAHLLRQLRLASAQRGQHVLGPGGGVLAVLSVQLVQHHLHWLAQHPDSGCGFL